MAAVTKLSPPWEQDPLEGNLEDLCSQPLLRSVTLMYPQSWTIKLDNSCPNPNPRRNKKNGRKKRKYKRQQTKPSRIIASALKKKLHLTLLEGLTVRLLRNSSHVQRCSRIVFPAFCPVPVGSLVWWAKLWVNCSPFVVDKSIIKIFYTFSHLQTYKIITVTNESSISLLHWTIHNACWGFR